MFTTVIKIALQLLAGVGIGHFADKLAADKLPAYPSGGTGLSLTNIPKVVWIVVFMVAGVLLARFIGRKFKINILK